MEDVRALLERPKFYQNIDGAGELATGCMVIGFIVFESVATHAPQDSIWNRVYTWIIFVTLLITAIHYGTKAMKSHITYRRTGFVSYRKRDLYWPGLIGFVMASAVSGLGVFTIRRGEIDYTVLTIVGAGLFLAATYAYGIARAVRWKWIVATLLMIGAIVIALLPVQLASAPISQSLIAGAHNVRLLGSLVLYLTFYGVILLISGGVSLALYLHGTRGAETE